MFPVNSALWRRAKLPRVKCLGCNTHQTVALDIVRRPKATPVHELERYMRCNARLSVQAEPSGGAAGDQDQRERSAVALVAGRAVMFEQGSKKMAKAYLIVEHIITDAEKFEEYRAKVGPMIAKHGGKYLTKGGSHKFPEGGHWQPDRVVVIEFPDMEALNAWYNSPEYQPLIALRKQCTSNVHMMITLEGE